MGAWGCCFLLTPNNVWYILQPSEYIMYTLLNSSVASEFQLCNLCLMGKPHIVTRQCILIRRKVPGMLIICKLVKKKIEFLFQETHFHFQLVFFILLGCSPPLSLPSVQPSSAKSTLPVKQRAKLIC